MSCNLFCASFPVTPCFVMAVQPCMEWTPILKKLTLNLLYEEVGMAVSLVCNTGIFRKLKILKPFCSTTPSDNYLSIKACSWNGWCHSTVQQKNHPRSFCEVFLSMLTFLPWHRKMLLFRTGGFVSTPLQILETWFDHWCNNKLLNNKLSIIKKQIISHNWEEVC